LMHLQQLPSREGPIIMRAAGRGPRAMASDNAETAKHIAPSLTKIVNVQKRRKKDASIVVMALPTAAPPKDFTE